MKLNYKKACKKLLDKMEEEYYNGAKAMLTHLQEDATNCYGNDNCVICLSGFKFLKKIKNEKVPFLIVF